MCGISGMWLIGKDVDRLELEKMGNRLSHRGPDNFAFLVLGKVGMAHNRLSIIDVSAAGNQPFHYDDRYLIYNGEIYNHQELRKDLAARGCKFVGASDTEVLFWYLVYYGVPETLRKIKGMYAFAYYNQENEALYLCRDRYGIKPLFWTYNSRGLFWASEIKALTAVAGVVLDPIRSLFSVTGSGDQSNRYTVFQNVQHVPPGHYLEVKGGGLPVDHEYYSVLHDIDDVYHRELSEMPSNQVLDLFLHLLEKSVQGMLMSDVPLGIFVSGGIDSSLIAALACRHQTDIMLFTSDVVGEFSELPSSQFLSETLHTPLFVSRFGPEQILEDIAGVTYHYEAPVVKFVNAIPMARVAELARQQGVKPVLTGEGSDELFLGYPALHYASYQKILELPAQAIKRFYRLFPILRSYVEKSEGLNINIFIASLVMGFERDYLKNRGGLQTLDFLQQNDKEIHYKSIQMMREHLVALLHRNDRMGMQYSIESRFPFLDEELVRFGLNLPLKWKRRVVTRVINYKHPFLMDKAVVRLAAERLLPRQFTDKPKWGFGIYGFNHMKVDLGYFRRGYLADLLGLDDAVLEYLVTTQDRFLVAKLVSLEVFGRIFGRGEIPETVTEHNLKYLRMETGV